MISKISVISTKDIGGQILKHHLTPIEKKILIQMLNRGMDIGRVRNKEFEIKELGDGVGDVKIWTREKSIILGRDEWVTKRVRIKWS